MHDFQRDAQWATSQNPGLLLSGDSSLHECFGVPFHSCGFPFFRGSRKVVPVHDYLQLVVPGPAQTGVVVLAHIFCCQICLSQNRRIVTVGFAVYWIFFMLSVITVPSSRQRHSDNEVCSLYFILASIFSVGALPLSIGVFVSHLSG